MNNQSLLSSARVKVVRAYKQLNELESEVQMFSERKPYRIIRESDFNSRDEILIYEPTELMPLEWSTIIGEILYNLRSALDQAVHELSILETGNPVKRSEFPICETKDSFESKSSANKIRGLSQKTQDIIKQLQPYYMEQFADGRVSAIKILHDMNIMDKHKELHIFRITIKGFCINVPTDGIVVPMRIYRNVNLNERVEVARLSFPAELDRKMDLNAEVAINIAFDSRNFSVFDKPEPVFDILKLLIFATDDVLNRLTESVS
jgi:hypothetical protein